MNVICQIKLYVSNLARFTPSSLLLFLPASRADDRSPFSCAVCNATFASSCGVRKHFKNKHIHQSYSTVAADGKLPSTTISSSISTVAVVVDTKQRQEVEGFLDEHQRGSHQPRAPPLKNLPRTTLSVESSLLGLCEKIPPAVRELRRLLTNSPRDCDEANVLFAGAQSMLLKVDVEAKTAPDVLRQQLSSGGGSSTQLRFFHGLQESDSIAKYARYASRMVMFARKLAHQMDETEMYDKSLSDNGGGEDDTHLQQYPWFTSDLRRHASVGLPNESNDLRYYDYLTAGFIIIIIMIMFWITICLISTETTCTSSFVYVSSLSLTYVPVSLRYLCTTSSFSRA